MSRARTLADLLDSNGDVKVTNLDNVPPFENIVDTGTEATKVAAGTTAQRPSSPQVGDIRYNSDIGKNEAYDADGWTAIAPPPVVTSVSPTSINESDTTQTIIITGQKFDANATALMIDSNGTNITPTTSTRNSSSQITIVYSGGDVVTNTNEPYDVKVVNGTGLSAVLEDAISLNETPDWSTTSGTVATVIEDVAMSSVQLSATDPEGTSVSYSVTSGALPTGLSLSSSGLISGTPNVNDTYNASGVTHNFTITATDGSNNAPRAFSILRKWADGLTSSGAATSAAAIKSIVGSPSSGVYWLKSSGINSGTPYQIYCDFTMDGGIGYAIYMNKDFNTNDPNASSGTSNGMERGPTWSEMTNSSFQGTAGYTSEYIAYSSMYPQQYNNGSGASRVIIGNRTNTGSSSGGIHSATYKYIRLTGLTPTQMYQLWDNYPGQYDYAPSFQAFGNTGTRDTGSGTCYIQGAHGSSGGVVQWVANSYNNVNDYLVFEYKPEIGTDPNHYWMVDNGQSGATYFRANSLYGTGGTFGPRRYGFIAVY